MAFKGNISPGRAVEVELQLDNTARGSAQLAVSFADNGGGSGADSVVVAPGGSGTCRVQTNAGPTGRLVIFVDSNNDGDTGHLTVRADGQTRDSEAVKGDTQWSYSIA